MRISGHLTNMRTYLVALTLHITGNLVLITILSNVVLFGFAQTAVVDPDTYPFEQRHIAKVLT